MLLFLEIMTPARRPKSTAIISAYATLATVAIGILAHDFSPQPERSSDAQTVSVKAATLEISAIVADALASH